MSVLTIIPWGPLAAFGLLVACSEHQSEPDPIASPWTAGLEMRVKDAYPRSFTNVKGQQWVIQTPPQRIASGTLFTDVVLSVICDKNRIVAMHQVSKNPLFSPIAEFSSKFGYHLTSDPETILAVQPDLVFLASFSDKRLDGLLSSDHRQVIRLHNLNSLAGVRESIRAVGYIVGRDRSAEDLVRQMDQRLDAVAKASASRRNWRVLSWSSGFVAGRGTIFSDVLGYVGATNLANEFGVDGARRIQPERLLASQPDALVIGVAEGKQAQARESLLRVAVMHQVHAVRDQRIVWVPNHLLLSTTQHVAGLAERIASQLDQWGSPR